MKAKNRLSALIVITSLLFSCSQIENGDDTHPSSSSSSSSSMSENASFVSINFGTNKYCGDNCEGEMTYSVTGADIATFSRKNVFYPTKDEGNAAILLGSEDECGFLSITFSQQINVYSVYLLLSSYTEDTNFEVAIGNQSSVLRVTENNDFDNDDYRSSSWLNCSFSGASYSVLRLSTIAGAADKRVYLSKLVILRKEKIEDSSSSSSSNTSSYPLPSTAYRFPRIMSNGSEASIYAVNQLSDGSYSCSLKETIYKDQYYIEPYQVAAYYQAFSSFPSNYVSSTSAALKIDQKMGRYYSTYKYGSYSGSSDYTESIGPWSQKSAPYYELDISTSSLNPNYNNGSRINRGTCRIVIMPSESSTSYQNADNGYDSICFLTTDHYSSFKEYLNFYNGWGESFKGANGSKRDFPTTIPWDFF